jgi:uncharacterized protein (TIGR02266 family)
MSGIDQRRYPRIEANVYVDYTGEEVLLFHTIENISLGGISIVAPTVEKIGTTVELVLNFPDNPLNLECFGEVVWSHEGEEGRMGIKFLSLTEDQKTRLRAFLARIDTFYADDAQA